MCLIIQCNQPHLFLIFIQRKHKENEEEKGRLLEKCQNLKKKVQDQDQLIVCDTSIRITILSKI